MKISRGMTMAFLAAGTIGSAAALADALDADSQARRVAIDPPPEPQRYGPGTGTVPQWLEDAVTDRDRAKMAAAEEKRARQRARNLRAAGILTHDAACRCADCY